MLKIRGKAVDFPVAVAGWLWAVAALDFLRLVGALLVAFGAPGGGLGKRARGSGVSVTPRGGIGGICGPVSGAEGFGGGWSVGIDPDLAQPCAGRKGVIVESRAPAGRATHIPQDRSRKGPVPQRPTCRTRILRDTWPAVHARTRDTLACRPEQGRPVKARPDRAATDDVPGLAARRSPPKSSKACCAGTGRSTRSSTAPAPTPGSRGLAERDRALTRALVAAVLRRLGTLRHLIGLFLEHGLPAKAPRVETALLIGAAQILFLDVPDHAAVDLAVRLARADHHAAHYAGLVNAVLRRIAREGAERLAALDHRRARHAAMADGALDHDLWRGDGAVPSPRRNGREPALDLTVKSDPEDWAAQLGGRVLPTGSVRTIAHGAVTALPGFAEGAWWVQDAAAAMPARLLGNVAGLRVADLVRGARRQSGAACRGRRARHRGRPRAGAALPPARKSRPAVARRRARLRRCRGMEGRAVRRRAARRAVLLDRHHPPPSRRAVAQDAPPTSQSSPPCSAG